MDNRLNHIATGPYGFKGEGSTFDMEQYLAYFDYEVLMRRGLQDRIKESITKPGN